MAHERSSISRAPGTKASRTASALSPMTVQQRSITGEPAPATGAFAAHLGRPPAETAVAAGDLPARLRFRQYPQRSKCDVNPAPQPRSPRIHELPGSSVTAFAAPNSWLRLIDGLCQNHYSYLRPGQVWRRHTGCLLTPLRRGAPSSSSMGGACSACRHGKRAAVTADTGDLGRTVQRVVGSRVLST